MASKKETRDKRYVVIRDTREQEGGNRWTFPASPTCVGTVDQTMKTGDYTLIGYETLLSVERKASTSEVSTNIFEKRFVKEFERLEEFQYPFLVCEFTLADIVNFPFNSGIPQKLWGNLRMTPQLLMKKINELQIRFKTKWVFAGTYGREFTSSLFKRVIEDVEQDENYFKK